MQLLLLARGAMLASCIGFVPLILVQPVSAFVGGNVSDTPARNTRQNVRAIHIAAEACPSGLVWREKFSGDTVCVTPAERDDYRRHRGLSAPTAAACPSGLVWREKFEGDTECVLPGERDANRRKRGLPTAAAAPCPSGLVWREQFDGDTVCVTPVERDANRHRRGLQ